MIKTHRICSWELGPTEDAVKAIKNYYICWFHSTSSHHTAGWWQ